MITGKPVLFSGGQSGETIGPGAIGAFAQDWTLAVAAAPALVGNSGFSDTSPLVAFDASMFSYSQGFFTCISPGNYIVTIWARGGNVSSPAARPAYYELQKNGQAVTGGSGSTSSSTSDANKPALTNISLDLAAGDTIALLFWSAAATFNVRAGLIIYPQT